MSRRKKASALNVIGMWYKYYAYREKNLSQSDQNNVGNNNNNNSNNSNNNSNKDSSNSNNHNNTKNSNYNSNDSKRSRSSSHKEQLSLKEKIRFARLKINMCQEISLWRMLRHGIYLFNPNRVKNTRFYSTNSMSIMHLSGIFKHHVKIFFRMTWT